MALTSLAVTLAIPPVPQLGMNYYHESMGDISRTLSQINTDLSTIKDICTKLKVYHNPYDPSTIAQATLIVQRARSMGFYVVWCEATPTVMLTDTILNTSAAPPQYPWADYRVRVIADAALAWAAGANEFLVGNNLGATGRNNGDIGYGDTNLPSRIRGLVTDCATNFPTICSYQEVWYKAASWVSAGLGALPKIYFTLYETYNTFLAQLAYISANFLNGTAEIGEMSSSLNMTNLQYNDDDWARALVRRYDQMQDTTLTMWIFTFRDTIDAGYGLLKITTPTIVHSVWNFLNNRYSYKFTKYYDENFADGTMGDFAGDGSNVGGQLQAEQFNTGSFLGIPLSDYAFRGLITLITLEGPDSWASARLIVRYTDTNNYYFVAFNINSSVIQVWRRLAGVETHLSDYNQTLALGVPYDFEIRVQGIRSQTRVQAFWNEIKVIDLIDGGNTSYGPALNQGNAGVKNNGISCQIDNILVHSLEIAVPYVAPALIVTASQVSTTITSRMPSAIPSFTKGVFGIGTYQSVGSGGVLFETGFPKTSSPNAIIHPWGGVYGGLNGYVLDTTIRPPQSTTYAPAESIGLDTTGLAVVRGYPQITWTWGTLRPDHWYYFLSIWKQAQYAPPGFKALVLIQYPETSTNIPQVILARMEPPVHSNRDVGSFTGVTLKFTYVGQAQLFPGVLVQILS